MVTATFTKLTKPLFTHPSTDCQWSIYPTKARILLSKRHLGYGHLKKYYFTKHQAAIELYCRNFYEGLHWPKQ